MGRVTEAEDGGGVFFFRDFFEEMARLGAGEERIGAADFLFGVVEGGSEQFGGLHCADVGAADEQIGLDLESGDALGDLFGFVDAFFGEIALGIGGRFRIFAVDGDAVADDVQLHF